MSHNIKIFAFPVLWALFIAFLCGIPGKDIPHISFLELLSFDKFVHATLFFILVWSIYKAVNKTNAYKQALIYALSFSIPYGGVLEILQQELFDERTADLFDFIANTFGCIVASIYIVSKKKKRKKINVK
ncbi:MAG: VanZ family protein [Bacteroidia bacterium]|nr:VanZ family protein [Bacteroidia bacterium]MCZ2249356.1 VanZ family protein [Bacteroidia bacterium]